MGSSTVWVLSECRMMKAQSASASPSLPGPTVIHARRALHDVPPASGNQPERTFTAQGLAESTDHSTSFFNLKLSFGPREPHLPLESS